METTSSDTPEVYRAPDTGDAISLLTVSEPEQLEPASRVRING